MDLLTHIRARPSGASQLSASLGIAAAFLYQIAHGKRRASPALARRIEDATNGAVCRRDLRPDDWGDIWPELIDVEHPWTARGAVAPDAPKEAA